MRISVLKEWDGPNLSKQWPAVAPAEFSGIEFEFDAATCPDHIVYLNGPPELTRVRCAPDRVWALIQEPPASHFKNYHEGQEAFSRVYTTKDSYADKQHVPFWGALEWHVKRTYDQLVSEKYPVKTGQLSWITSNKGWLDGHQTRMRFLQRLRRSALPLDLWGRGFKPVEDKWDGLAPYRYSIAFENLSNDLYWTEKLADCFLAYCTPFYYGARTIDRYFPPNSYIWIDPDDPHVFRKMQDRMAEGFHQSHLDALLEARDLCLNKYNTLVFIAREVMAYKPAVALEAEEIEIQPVTVTRRSRGQRILARLGSTAKRAIGSIERVFSPRRTD